MISKFYPYTPNAQQIFNPTSTLLFLHPLSAADVTVSQSGSSTLFTTALGTMTLLAMSPENISTSNTLFLDHSLLLVGDNNAGTTAADNSANTLNGGTQNDRLYGMGGSDTLSGNGGNDVIFGGASESDPGDAGDSIDGGDGSDLIYGNGGNDTITGSSDQDSIYGGVGNDSITYSSSTDNILVYGNQDGDTILSGAGNDTIFGGSSTSDSSDGADSINGGDGSDLIYSNGGNDTIIGSAGNDSIYAGSGNDTITYTSNTTETQLYGNEGSDTISSGSGSDTIYGGSSTSDTGDEGDRITGNGGADLIYGNGGNDTITGTAAGGNDTVYGGIDTDVIDYSADTTSTDKILIFGNEGSDRITGSSGNDTIYGGSSAADITDGSDSITAGIGADLVYGASGDDTITGSGNATASSTIYGGTGNDIIDWSALSGFGGVLYGGDGADTISGAETGNTIEGGNGNDSIISASGETVDNMIGGAGSDIFVFNTVSAFTANDTILGGDYTSDNSSDTDTLQFGQDGEQLITAEKLAHISGIEVISLFSDADDNEVILTDAFVGLASGGVVTISIQNIGEGLEQLTVDASAVTTSTNRINATGGNGGDDFTGGAGNDTFNGGNGGDTFYETVIGGIGSDVINGGAGNDFVSITSTNFTSALTLAGGDDTDNIVFTDTATVIDADFTHVTSIEQLLFDVDGNRVVLGTYVNNMMGSSGTLSVGGGDSTITSLDSSAISSDRDVLISTTGTVTLADSGNRVTAATGISVSIIGGSGADSITGANGADTLNGSAGNDTITGGSNTEDAGDSMTGGGNTDRFYFAQASDTANTMNGTETSTAKIDSITDFISADDKIILSSAEDAFADGETLLNGDTTVQIVGSVLSGTGINTFNDLITAFQGNTPGTASTSSNLYIYDWSVEAAGNFTGTHIIVINNGTAAIGFDDAFIVLSGTSSDSVVAEDFNFSLTSTT